MLNNPQRHHVSGHVRYPQQHYALAPTGLHHHHFDFGSGHVDPVLGAYHHHRQQDVQHSMYAREDYGAGTGVAATHLAPPPMPAQHSALLPQSYANAASANAANASAITAAGAASSAITTATNTSTSSTPFRPYEHPLSHRTRAFQQSSYRSLATPICAPPLSIMDDDQFAHMQQLSAEYEPEAKGPLAGQLQPSNVIIQEFATADPIYQRKTASLASTYSHLRAIRGDGQCGWRAVAFAYFERLLSSRDPNHLLQAETRLRSSVNLIKTTGIAADIYDDFSQETYSLLRDLSEGLRTANAESILLERFNDEMVQNYIITQLKSLTTAWMKSHVDEYSNFLPDLNIDSYCEQHVMPLKSQMDQVSLMALKDVLLVPAGIGLEVEYLDLSPGQDGTLHRLTRADQSIDMGVVRLLYRPGHYDILYKSEDLTPPPVAAYLQFSPRSYNEPVTALPNADFMYMIPGMSGVHPTHDGWAAASQYDFSDLFDTATPPQPCPQPLIAPNTAASKAPVRAMQQNYYLPPQQPVPMLPPQEQVADDYIIRTATLRTTTRPPVIAGGPFRLTDWHHKQETTNTPSSQVQLQTTQFKNSHYNPAHFNNPDFQPETWSPEKEKDKGAFESDSHGSNSKNGRHRKSR